MREQPSGLRRFFSNFTMTLASGRVINLTSLSQRLTYLELLEGLPWYDPQMVERNRARAESGHDCPAVTVAARPTPLPLSPDERERLSKRSSRELTSLPAVTCVARFESASPVRGEDADTSALVLVWYQDCFGLPQEPGLLEEIRQVDWDAAARNDCF